jgi:chromosome segregation ATPase
MEWSENVRALLKGTDLCGFCRDSAKEWAKSALAEIDRLQGEFTKAATNRDNWARTAELNRADVERLKIENAMLREDQNRWENRIDDLRDQLAAREQHGQSGLTQERGEATEWSQDRCELESCLKAGAFSATRGAMIWSALAEIDRLTKVGNGLLGSYRAMESELASLKDQLAARDALSRAIASLIERVTSLEKNTDEHESLIDDLDNLLSKIRDVLNKES